MDVSGAVRWLTAQPTAIPLFLVLETMVPPSLVWAVNSTSRARSRKWWIFRTAPLTWERMVSCPDQLRGVTEQRW